MICDPQTHDVVVRVEVTADDIEHGVQGDCERCPLACATSRASGCGVSIDGGAILFWRSGQRMFDMNTPKEFQLFMAKFDGYGAEQVEPFTYELSVPAWVVDGRAA